MSKRKDYAAHLKHAEAYQLPALLAQSSRWRPGKWPRKLFTAEWLEAEHDDFVMRVIRLRTDRPTTAFMPLFASALRVVEGSCDVMLTEPDSDPEVPRPGIVKVTQGILEASAGSLLYGIHPVGKEALVFSIHDGERLRPEDLQKDALKKPTIRELFNTFRARFPHQQDSGVS